MKKLEKMLYECQIGMYIDELIKLKSGFIVYSKYVEDKSWNYFTCFKAFSRRSFLKLWEQAKDKFLELNRKPYIALSPSTRLAFGAKRYFDEHFELDERVTVMLCRGFDKKFDLDSDYTFKRIDNNLEKEVFINTFTTSKTQVLPGDTYDKLPSYYFDALRASFEHSGEWEFIHYLSYYKSEPIGMVSVCKKGEYAGLYGGGTYAKFRGKGVFTNLLNFISQQLQKEGVKYFFGITEKDSKNERYYNKLGWNEAFEIDVYYEQ